MSCHSITFFLALHYLGVVYGAVLGELQHFARTYKVNRLRIETRGFVEHATGIAFLVLPQGFSQYLSELEHAFSGELRSLDAGLDAAALGLHYLGVQIRAASGAP